MRKEEKEKRPIEDDVKEIIKKEREKRAHQLAEGLKGLGINERAAVIGAWFLSTLSETFMDVGAISPLGDIRAELQLGGAPLEVLFSKTGIEVNFNCSGYKREDLGQVRIHHSVPLDSIQNIDISQKAVLLIDKEDNAVGFKEEGGNVSFSTGPVLVVKMDLDRG